MVDPLTQNLLLATDRRLSLQSKIQNRKSKIFSEALASPLADNGIRHHQHHGSERE